jgi:hypothetical protein
MVCIGSKAADLMDPARKLLGSMPSEHGRTPLGKSRSALGKVGALAALVLALT